MRARFPENSLPETVNVGPGPSPGQIGLGESTWVLVPALLGGNTY